MKRAYSPKEIAAKKWVTLPWDEKWSKPFGFPAENASWFISGASASGKSSFVMQLGKELCNYGTVLYMSYEEKINQSFQRRMGYLKMNEVQGKFRVVTEGSLEEVIARLKKPKSPKFIIIDSFQVAGWDYPQAVELMETFPKKWAKISLGMFVMGLILCFLSPLQDHRFSWKDDVYPANALYNLYFAINKAERNRKYHITSADFKFDATKLEQAEGKREIYVLVVGETSRAMEWSLYGYERKTTPRMEALDGLVHFTDVVTQSNNTHKSVPIILSAASAENYGVLYDEKSIVTAFKEAGFRTLVIANQKLTTSMIGAFYREADTFIDMSAFNTGSTLTSLHDAAILPYLKKELDKEDGNLFVVLHTYGSHFNYHERYPKEFRFYRPDKAEGIRASYKKELRNAYDNSIHYTDYVLGEIVDMLAKTNAPASMLYLSDHGEDIFDDSRARYLHASPIPTYYQLHIPYVIWFSKAYRESYPQKYLEAQAHETYPVSTNSVFHTMLDIAGVRTPVADSTFALTNRAFKVRDRMYLGDHDDPIPFWKVGLKKQDFEMMDKWDIAYDRN